MPTFQPQGRIKLIKDVDIDISYTHQYYFENTDRQMDFFDAKVFKELENGTYQRKNINSIQVPYGADEISECKYLYWSNQPYDTKRYYAFVTSIDYINPGVSQINYQLDVYQTYMFNVTWKQSFIEREHTNRWMTVGNETVPVINTEPEGLEYGSEYRIISESKLEQIPDVGWIVFGSTKFGNSSSARQVGNMPTGVVYTFVPVCLNQKKIITFMSGTREIVSPQDALDVFANDTNFVNSLVSCVFYPFLPIRGIHYSFTQTSETRYTCDLTFDAPISEKQIISGNNPAYVLVCTGLVSASNDFIVPVELEDSYNLYDQFPNYTESKLLMFPYSFIELTDKRGDSMVLKMEYFNDRSIPIKIGAFGTISSVNKMTYAIKHYLTYLNGYNLSIGMNDASNSNLPITDSYTASYLQANSNSLRVAESNARYSQLTTIDNAYRSYETAMAKRTANAVVGGVETAMDLASAVAGTLSPNGSGLGYGNSAVSGLAGTIADYITSGQQANTDYWNKVASATTDYANTQASIMAKKNDAQQIPPSSKNLGGDYFFNIVNNCNALYLQRKTIYPEYADKLADFFKQYGYKVNRLEAPQFHTRESWNYIKMAEPNVYGNIPMDDLMRLRDIFIKGITLWHGDYIGDYTRSNNEI